MVLFFFYFPIKVAGATLLVAGENPRPPALNDNPEGPYSFELLKFHDFFHHLFTFSMTLCFAVTFKNVQNIPCFRVFFALNSSTDKLWCPPKCVSFALFNYSTLSYIDLALSSAVTNVANKTEIKFP